jgi:hypothetical protein
VTASIVALTLLSISVIPGRRESGEPGIHNHGREWIGQAGVMDSGLAGKSPRPGMTDTSARVRATGVPMNFRVAVGAPLAIA